MLYLILWLAEMCTFLNRKHLFCVLFVCAGLGLFAATSYAQDRLYPVRSGNGFGFINSTGELEIEARFDSALDFEDGLAPVKITGLWGFVNKQGDIVIDALYDRVHVFSEGLAR